MEHTLKTIGEVEEDIVPGKRKRLSFKLTPGHDALICNKPGHYEAGMHTALVVTPRIIPPDRNPARSTWASPTSFRITRSLIPPSPERGAARRFLGAPRASGTPHTLATCRERVRDDTRSLK